MTKVKSALKEAPRKKKKRYSGKIDQDLLAMYGHVPEFENVTDENFNTKFTHALNWCQRGVENKQARLELIQWMTDNNYKKADITAVKSHPEYTNVTYGNIAFLINNGWTVPDDIIVRMKNTLQTMINSAVKPKKEKPIDVYKEPIQNKNIQEAWDIVDVIEENAFNLIEMNSKQMVEITSGKKINVIELASKRLQEIYDEVSLYGKDDDVTEAYKHVLAKNVKKILSCLDAAIKSLHLSKTNKITVRKPRTVKAKSSTVLVKKLQYKAEDANYNLTGVDPTSIIGAKKLLVFNTKLRKIALYNAKDDTGFSVSGTTLTNCDEKSCKTKLLKDNKSVKIADTLLSFRTATVKRADKLFADINTVETDVSPRFNQYMIILKVFK